MRRWIVLAAVLVFAACGKDKNVDAPAKLLPFSASLKVSRVWTAKVDDKKGAKLRLGLGLALDGNRIYAAGHKGELVALDANSGRQIWRVKTKLELAGGAGVGNGMVAIGSSRGDVLAVSVSDGAKLWSVRLNGEVLAPPAISDRVVVVRTVDGKLHGLAPNDGHELWSQEQQVPRLSLRGTSRPVLTGDLALCGFDNGKVMAVNVLDGSVQWEATVSPPHGRTELERLIDIDSAVDVVGQDVYAVGFQGRIAMLALDNGQVWWSHEASSYRGLGIDDDALYLSTADGDVVSMRRRTGTELWRQTVLARRLLSKVVTSNDALVVGDFQGYVHWLDKSTGALIARDRAGKVRISTPPVVSGNMVYVINDAGAITAFRVQPKPGAPRPKAPPAPAAPAADKSAPAAPDSTAPAADQSTGGAATATPTSPVDTAPAPADTPPAPAATAPAPAPADQASDAPKTQN
jgi:outer membrane protein assembly factor BamB